MTRILKAGHHPGQRRSVVSVVVVDAVAQVEPQGRRERVAQQAQALPTLALQATLMI